MKAKFERDGSEEELDLEPSEYTVEDGKVVIAGGGGTQWSGVAAQASLAGWIKLVVTASGKSDEIRLTLKE